MNDPKTASAEQSGGSAGARGSAAGVESETWQVWLRKQHAALDLDKPEDYGMFLAFAIVETRLRRIGQYTGDSPPPNAELSDSRPL